MTVHAGVKRPIMESASIKDSEEDELPLKWFANALTAEAMSARCDSETRDPRLHSRAGIFLDGSASSAVSGSVAKWNIASRTCGIAYIA